MTDTAAHVLTWTEYAVQFADGMVTKPMSWEMAWKIRDAHAGVTTSSVRVVQRTVTPWRPL